jgi:hypothetical protein
VLLVLVLVLVLVLGERMQAAEKLVLVLVSAP